MPTRKRTQKRRAYRTTKDLNAQMFLELQIGPSRPRRINHDEPAGSPLRYGPLDPAPLAFPDEATRQAIWNEVRDDFLAKCRPGQRPWAWRYYDCPEPYGEHETKGE